MARNRTDEMPNQNFGGPGPSHDVLNPAIQPQPQGPFAPGVLGQPSIGPQPQQNAGKGGQGPQQPQQNAGKGGQGPGGQGPQYNSMVPDTVGGPPGMFNITPGAVTPQGMMGQRNSYPSANSLVSRPDASFYEGLLNLGNSSIAPALRNGGGGGSTGNAQGGQAPGTPASSAYIGPGQSDPYTGPNNTLVGGVPTGDGFGRGGDELSGLTDPNTGNRPGQSGSRGPDGQQNWRPDWMTGPQQGSMDQLWWDEQRQNYFDNIGGFLGGQLLGPLGNIGGRYAGNWLSDRMSNNMYDNYRFDSPANPNAPGMNDDNPLNSFFNSINGPQNPNQSGMGDTTDYDPITGDVYNYGNIPAPNASGSLLGWDRPPGMLSQGRNALSGIAERATRWHNQMRKKSMNFER